MMETVVEVSTECGPMEEDSFPIPPECEPAAKKKRGGQCHYSTPDVTWDSPRLNVKRRVLHSQSNSCQCWRLHKHKLFCVCVSAGGRKPKTNQPASNGSFDLGIKKRPREGKGLFY